MSLPHSNSSHPIDIPILHNISKPRRKRTLIERDQRIGIPGSKEREDFRANMQQKLQALGKSNRPQWVRELSVKASLALLQQQMLPNNDDGRTAKAIIVSLDFGRYDAGKSNVSEIGIAALDMRELHKHRISNPSPMASQNYRYYTLLEEYEFTNSGLGERFISDGFCWGTTKCRPPSQMKELLEQTIQQLSPSGEQRDVILVFHYAYVETTVLQHLGIDLLDTARFPNLLGIIDTQVLACSLIPRTDGILDSYKRYALDDLVQNLQIPFWKLHISGNDANATLKALILLACLHFQKLDLTLLERDKMSKLIAIAKESVPARFGERFARRNTRAGARRFMKRDWLDHLNDDGFELVILDDFECTPTPKERMKAADWAQEFEDNRLLLFGNMDN